MKFGECYKILEEGGFVSRMSWSGIFIWLKPKANVKSEWCKDPILKMLADVNGGEVKAEQVLCKYDNLQKNVMTGWSPQQDDLAADDWSQVSVKQDGKKLDIKFLYDGIEQKIDVNKLYVGDLFDGADVIRKP
jgi:hypothetical protein